MSNDLARALSVAVAAAREAGDLLRADLHRAAGPRGAVDKAEADTEAEHIIRAKLTGAFPRFGYLGEETGAAAGETGAPIWLVDPNDGTRDYLKGRRGSAVSIGLLVDRVPRLGVVFAFAYPDDAGDLFAWAEGCGPLLRNDRPLSPGPSGALGAADVVLVSSAGDEDVAGNLACMAPARMRTLPSIAHRLALVAAGEAAAAISLHRPGAWDYGGGHALLRGAGAALVDEAGEEIAYGEGGRSRCSLAFAGSASVARGLAARDWRKVDTRGPGRVTIPGVPARLPLGAAVADAGLLGRAQGCLLGQLSGDSLGALVEFSSAAEVAAGHPDGPRLLADGGHWGILAGQPTDDSEMALALARTMLDRGGFDAVALRHAYVSWIGSGPFDAGRTVTSALNGKPDPESQANGALMRASPLGLLAHAQAPAFAAEVARRDAELTHPNPACLDANAAFVVAVAHAVRHGDGAEAAWQAAHGWAKAAGAATLVLDALAEARSRPPVCDPAAGRGWVRVALQNAFYELLHAPSLEAGVVATVRRGGDTDTNAAITGALLGAVHGRDAIPRQWRSMVLSCRPLEGHALRPRPPQYWPADVLEIAERLLIIGQAV